MNLNLCLPETLRKATTALPRAAMVAALFAVAWLWLHADGGSGNTERFPAHTTGHSAVLCAPDDSLPIGPGGQGVPVCADADPPTTPIEEENRAHP
jgi:hypothetical protein